jgi:tetratricopeptide (TPR) repeat protein
VKTLLADADRLRNRGRTSEALGVYARVLELEPVNAEALAGRGSCYLEQSQYAPAKASFEEALRGNANYPDALMGLAETYRYEGRRADAVTYYRKYLAAHPHGRDAAAAQSAIDALQE